jgi:hypothetical protein
MRLRNATVVALALCFAGCRDTPSEPGATLRPGTIRFNYSGPISGSFRSTGEYRANEAAGPRDFAYAVPSPLTIVGYDSTAADRLNMIMMDLRGRDRPGSWSTTPMCGAQEPECAIVYMVFDRALSPTGVKGVERYTVGAFAGTVTIVERTATDLRGTFSGSGTLVEFTGGTYVARGTVSVTGGVFDVPVIYQSNLP